MNFDALVHAIADIHLRTQSAAAGAVNIALTCRNWMIGAYIVEFEQRGEDRAAYGDRLLFKLAERLQRKNIPRSDERELRRFRQFYLAYPQIRDTVSPEFGEPSYLPEKRDSASPEKNAEKQHWKWEGLRRNKEYRDPIKEHTR